MTQTAQSQLNTKAQFFVVIVIIYYCVPEINKLVIHFPPLDKPTNQQITLLNNELREKVSHTHNQKANT